MPPDPATFPDFHEWVASAAALAAAIAHGSWRASKNDTQTKQNTLDIAKLEASGKVEIAKLEANAQRDRDVVNNSIASLAGLVNTMNVALAERLSRIEGMLSQSSHRDLGGH